MKRFLLFFMVACGSSTTNGDGGTGGPVSLATLDDVCDGVQGFTGRALLAKVPMPTKATFTYVMKSGGTPMPSPFTLDVAYMGGVITCTPHRDPPPGSKAPSLPASLRIEVVVGFKTDDGAFAETGLAGTVDGTLAFLSLSASEPSTSIKGTYKPTMTSLSVSGSYGAMAPNGNVSEGGGNSVTPVGGWK